MNDYGQLGDGTTNNRSTPIDVVGLTDGVRMVSAGDWHTCAITAGGGAKCWGENQSGALGDGTWTHRLTPADVVGLSSGVGAVQRGLARYLRSVGQRRRQVLGRESRLSAE